jgi:hypothetical protein
LEQAAARERARVAALAAAVAETVATAKAQGPLLETQGYIVKGTDELSYKPCGSSKVYFVKARGEPAVKVAQTYRFSAASPLSPVYYELRAHLYDDTASLGDTRYTSIADVRTVVQHPGKPACPPPLRGSFIRPR